MLAQAVILCGGAGTRLGTLTASTPKPLLPISGRPFLDHLIQEVARYGVTRITLIAGHFGQQIADTYHGRRMYGAGVEVLIEPEPMGTGGALRFAAPHLEREFFLMNGDSWVDADLVAVAQFWAATRAAKPVLALLLLQHVPDAGRFGSVRLSDPGADAGILAAYCEKSSSTVGISGRINAGVYVLDRAVVDNISASGPVSLEKDVLPLLVAQGRVYGLTVPKGRYFIDIGLPETFEKAQHELLLRRTRPALFLDRDGTLNVDHGYTHKVEDLQWQPGAREAIALANRMGWFVFVVTNQAGVAHGYYDVTAVEAFHAAMQADLFAIGAHVDAFEWCPFHPEGRVSKWRAYSRRRKPEPGMIEDLLAEWPVDRSRSLMIGDQESDMSAAATAGVRGVLYRGGSLVELLQQSTEWGQYVDQ
jgi:D-glycero-D-manno-heptose 1,7-bisphosphate phosphatase